MSERFERLKQLLSSGVTSDECLFYDCSDNIIEIGGTKIQTFKMPLKAKGIKKLVLVYTQDKHIILKKTLKDFKVSDFDNSLIYFNLLETDTKKFKKGKVEAQLKVLLDDDSILVSEILRINAVESLGDLNFNIQTPLIESIQVTVDEQKATLIQFSTIAAESKYTHFCRFIFDSSWDTLTKIAVFKDEYNEYIDDVSIDKDTNTCIIPNSIIAQPGNVYIGVVGKLNNIVRPTEWTNAFRVVNSCTYKGFTYVNSDSQDDPIDVPYADEDTAGIMKLYNIGGQNTDGTVTQKAITDGFNSIYFDLDDFVNDCLVLNVDFEQENT